MNKDIDSQQDKCTIQKQDNSQNTISTNDASKKLKPCCACPDTKKARDECIIRHGEENCIHFINMHKQCMKSHGFII